MTCQPLEDFLFLFSLWCLRRSIHLPSHTGCAARRASPWHRSAPSQRLFDALRAANHAVSTILASVPVHDFSPFSCRSALPYRPENVLWDRGTAWNIIYYVIFSEQFPFLSTFKKVKYPFDLPIRRTMTYHALNQTFASNIFPLLYIHKPVSPFQI